MSGVPRILLAFDLIVVATSTLFARPAYYELFVDVPGVHSARWPDPWAMPKTAISIMLMAALVALVAAFFLVVILYDPDARRLARIVEVAALVTMVCAWLTWVTDFLGSAGGFG